MELTQKKCLEIKEAKRRKLKNVSIDEKVRRVEELRDRVQVIRELRNRRKNKRQSIDDKPVKSLKSSLFLKRAVKLMADD